MTRSAQQNKRIIGLRERAASAEARLAAARDRAAALSPAKVSATDPDSRLLPAKNGGYVQGWNVQAAAARRQVLTAIELHDNPADAGALITMIAAAAANCDLAGLRGQIRAWLAGNGYASAANFKALEHLMLLVAVRGEATQTGRLPGGTALPGGWQDIAARLATPAARACTNAAPPRWSRSSPSSSPGSAATSTTAAATPPTPSSSCSAPCTTSPSCQITGAGNSPPPDQAQPAATRQPPRHSSMPADPANPSGPAGDAQPSDDQPAS